MWWRRRSLRARLTLATSAGLALALALAAVLLVNALRVSLIRGLDLSARQGAVEVAALIDQNRLPNPVPVAPGTLTIQVLDASGRITNVSPGADRLVLSDEAISVSDLRHTAFYHEVLRPQDVAQKHAARPSIAARSTRCAAGLPGCSFSGNRS